MSIFISKYKQKHFSNDASIAKFPFETTFSKNIFNIFSPRCCKTEILLSKLLCFFILLYEHKVLSHMIIKGDRFFQNVVWRVKDFKFSEGPWFRGSFQIGWEGEIFRWTGHGWSFTAKIYLKYLLPKHTLVFHTLKANKFVKDSKLCDEKGQSLQLGS